MADVEYHNYLDACRHVYTTADVIASANKNGITIVTHTENQVLRLRLTWPECLQILHKAAYLLNAERIGLDTRT